MIANLAMIFCFVATVLLCIVGHCAVRAADWREEQEKEEQGWRD